ncbi:MAG: crotonase/enoyl-CoA hydratase family protein [Vulcanimicrobiaceae bacterium]|jgi:enoyl-CoA hydratase
MNGTVSYRPDERVAIVTIQRPERRNAVDETTAQALVAAFERFERDAEADVAILTGAGGTFCAGADLKAVAAGEFKLLSDGAQAAMGPTRLLLSKPVIAAVEGYAVAGGLELALWCDLRVAASDAVFGVFSRRFGLPLVDMGTVRLPRLIGHSLAMDLILTGRPVNAIEAKGIGLVNRIAPSGRALVAALELAKAIGAFPQLCLQNDRLALLEQWGLTEREAMQNELRHGLATFASGEAIAGALRFAKGAGRHGSFESAQVEERTTEN